MDKHYLTFAVSFTLIYHHKKKTKIDSLSYITKKTNFNRYRNTLNKTITNAKRVYYKAIFNLYKHDMKKSGVLSLKF